MISDAEGLYDKDPEKIKLLMDKVLDRMTAQRREAMRENRESNPSKMAGGFNA